MQAFPNLAAPAFRSCPRQRNGAHAPPQHALRSDTAAFYTGHS